MDTLCFECKNHLHHLNTLSPIERRKLIRKGSRKLINTICECADNVLNHNVPLSLGDRAALTLYKKSLRDVTDHRKPLKVRREIIEQEGGFLPIILRVALPFIDKLAELLLPSSSS